MKCWNCTLVSNWILRKSFQLNIFFLPLSSIKVRSFAYAIGIAYDRTQSTHCSENKRGHCRRVSLWMQCPVYSIDHCLFYYPVGYCVFFFLLLFVAVCLCGQLFVDTWLSIWLNAAAKQVRNQQIWNALTNDLIRLSPIEIGGCSGLMVSALESRSGGLGSSQGTRCVLGQDTLLS